MPEKHIEKKSNNTVLLVGIIIVILIAAVFLIYTMSGNGAAAPNLTTSHLTTTAATMGHSTATTLQTTTRLQTYANIINSNFGTGTYAGWTVNGLGFGTKPTNLTAANSGKCYLGQPWAGYNGTFFATTYTCGISSSAGNLTSSAFVVSPFNPYLNFKIVSSHNENLFVEIINSSGTPLIVQHYSTLNVTSYNGDSTFKNASINLTTLKGKGVYVRVVQSIILRNDFIAVGDFQLSTTPMQTNGITTT